MERILNHRNGILDRAFHRTPALLVRAAQRDHEASRGDGILDMIDLDWKECRDAVPQLLMFPRVVTRLAAHSALWDRRDVRAAAKRYLESLRDHPLGDIVVGTFPDEFWNRLYRDQELFLVLARLFPRITTEDFVPHDAPVRGNEEFQAIAAAYQPQ